MFLDIKTTKLPRYKGELELTEHSAGSLTSQAYQKRWNRKNELLADAAERASVVAMWLGARAYPQQRLEDAWALVMGGQFHDIAAGTSTPKAHSYSWNDDVLALNQFASVLISASEAVASALDTRVQGTAIVVYNPLSVDREDIVEADIPRPPPCACSVGRKGSAVADLAREGAVSRARAVGWVGGVRRAAGVVESSSRRVFESSSSISRRLDDSKTRRPRSGVTSSSLETRATAFASTKTATSHPLRQEAERERSSPRPRDSRCRPRRRGSGPRGTWTGTIASSRRART
jgi:alpha-mannosidase